MTRHARARRWRLAAALAVAALAVIVAASRPEPPRALEAARLLAALSAPPGQPGPPEAAAVMEVTYRARGQETRADLYLPGPDAPAALAGLVLVPGVAPAGRRDPRLVAAAGALARARFLVLVPDLANLRAQKVSPADAAEAAAAWHALAGHPAFPAGRPLGVVAFSYAAGPVLLAVLGEHAAHRPDFVVTVGAYYDLEAVVGFFTTGYFRAAASAEWQYLQPNAYGKWAFVLGNADRLPAPAERSALAAIARRKLTDPEAAIDDLTAGLGPGGSALLALLANREPEAVPALIAALPENIRADLAALTLKGRDWKALETRLLLIHGRDDAIIPFTESQALAQAAGAGAELYLPDHLAHVNFGPTGPADALTLWRAAYALLEARDGGGRGE